MAAGLKSCGTKSCGHQPGERTGGAKIDRAVRRDDEHAYAANAVLEQTLGCPDPCGIVRIEPDAKQLPAFVGRDEQIVPEGRNESSMVEGERGRAGGRG